MNLRRFGQEIAVALSSGAYLSFIPAWLLRAQRLTGAGLIGTIWGVFLLNWLPQDVYGGGIALMGFFFVSVALSDYAEEALGQIDDPRIVIDETIGYLLSVFLLPRSPAVLLSGFVLFRILDVYKPSLIRRAADLPGGWGIVLDDALAGVVANGVLRLAERIRPF